MDGCVKIFRKITLKIRDRLFVKNGTGFGTGSANSKFLENSSFSRNFKLFDAGSDCLRDRVRVQAKGQNRATNEEYINKKKCSSAEASSLAVFFLSKQGNTNSELESGYP
ncbi:MAG: hypothetical protein ACM3P0_00835 [Acidobacteriota bacterium]